MTTPTQGHFLTVPEVAQRLRVSRMTVYRLVSTGAFPTVRVGRSIRIPAVNFDAYLKRQTNGESDG